MRTDATARRAAGLVLLALPAALTGCAAGTGEVAGVVTYKGSPVAGATVEVVPATGVPVRTTTGSDGAYVLPAVPVGEARVLVVAVSEEFVRMREGQEDGNRGPRPKDGPRPKYSLLPEKYSRAATTPLALAVGPGRNPFDIALAD